MFRFETDGRTSGADLPTRPVALVSAAPRHGPFRHEPRRACCRWPRRRRDAALL